MTPQLEVEHLSVRFGTIEAVQDASMRLEPGVIGCLLGPSGCGKTTLLRVIAGFQRPTSGRVLLKGREVSRKSWAMPPEKRSVGMVFQDFALFPNLSLRENIAFGLRRLPRAYVQARVDELLSMIGLEGAQRSYPHQLSGGQQQRVALARAIAPRPEILLLDEPFSSMDVELREQLARDVRAILREEGITSVLVTHDQHEAFAMADLIGVMREGRIEQWDTAYNLYHQPANRFVGDFIGEGVLISGRVINSSEVETELGLITGAVPHGCRVGCPVDILIRPDDVEHDDASRERAQVVDKAFRGAEFLYTLRTANGTRILCLAPSHHDHAIDEEIGIRLNIDHLVVFRPTEAGDGIPPPEPMTHAPEHNA
jgi:iron(III) transport system ATP-binding protein